MSDLGFHCLSGMKKCPEKKKDEIKKKQMVEGTLSIEPSVKKLGAESLMYNSSSLMIQPFTQSLKQSISVFFLITILWLMAFLSNTEQIWRGLHDWSPVNSFRLVQYYWRRWLAETFFYNVFFHSPLNTLAFFGVSFIFTSFAKINGLQKINGCENECIVLRWKLQTWENLSSQNGYHVQN